MRRANTGWLLTESFSENREKHMCVWGWRLGGGAGGAQGAVGGGEAVVTFTQ